MPRQISVCKTFEYANQRSRYLQGTSVYSKVQIPAPSRTATCPPAPCRPHQRTPRFRAREQKFRARALQIKKAPGSLFQLLGARCLAVKTLVVAAGWQLRRKFVYCKYAETFPLICKREISQSLVLYWALRMRSSASRRLFWASRISMPERFPSI